MFPNATAWPHKQPAKPFGNLFDFDCNKMEADAMADAHKKMIFALKTIPSLLSASITRTPVAFFVTSSPFYGDIIILAHCTSCNFRHNQGEFGSSKTFQIIQKLSRLSGNFPDHLAHRYATFLCSWDVEI